MTHQMSLIPPTFHQVIISQREQREKKNGSIRPGNQHLRPSGDEPERQIRKMPKVPNMIKPQRLELMLNEVA
jgi:hypothetical protein